MNAPKQITGLAASFDLESFGLDPVYGRLLCGVILPWGSNEPQIFRVKQASSDDSKLVKTLIEELSKYAMLFAHNGLFYDRAMLNGRALQYGLPILDPKGKMIDPYQLARKHLNFKRNSLDALAAHCQLTDQKMHVSPEVWVKAALDHDKNSMDTIVERCVSDCYVLEQLVERVLPLVGNITPWGSA
jgi:DNA polymerase elongation subunit (family B)